MCAVSGLACVSVESIGRSELAEINLGGFRPSFSTVHTICTRYMYIHSKTCVRI